MSLVVYKKLIYFYILIDTYTIFCFLDFFKYFAFYAACKGMYIINEFYDFSASA